MMRINLDSPALIAVRNWLAGTAERSGRGRRRKASSPKLWTEQLEPRTMLDAGMRAFLADLVPESDTGTSTVDNLTSDRTPTFSGSVQGGASEVRLRIDGVRVATLPVTNGKWTYTVPAEAALAGGLHTINVRPIAPSGKAGALSKTLAVTVVETPPRPSTIVLGALSDSGMKGDGQTTFATPMLRGIAQPNRFVNISIDGMPVGRVRSDAKTGAWSLKSPQLANGVHNVTVVVENLAGLESKATSFSLTVNGERTVVLDATGGQTVELTASHLLGQASQGFIVTQVNRGTLQKWVAAKNEWLTIPTRAMKNTDPASLQKAAAIRKIAFNDVVRWTPARGDVGMASAFSILPIDIKGGPTAPTPVAGTVPGRLVSPSIDYTAGVGSEITWAAPTDGCGCASTRYSIQVTREDGKTLLYNVPSTVHGVSSVEGGAVNAARIWGATKTGAGEALRHSAIATERAVKWLNYTVTSGASFVGLGVQARAQLDNSPTATKFTTNHPLGGSHAQLAYLEVQALPDATEAAQGLPAETPMIISSDSNKLTPAQKDILKANPILAGHLFPGTVGGSVLPDQTRVHFQAGETLRFAGNVDASVRAGATIVVESAQILGDGSCGPWLEEARIPVGSDGGFSHDYIVPYGMVSLRKRLEYSTVMAPTSARSASTATLGESAPTPLSTPIDLSSYFNAFGITTGPWQVANNQGFDRNGNYYNSDYTGGSTNDPVPGTPITYAGIEFPIGPVPTSNSQVGGSKGPRNFVQAKGQTITVSVDAGKSDYLYLAGAASNGNQMSQAITLNFTDGTTETWYQSFHDWASGGPPQGGASADGNSGPAPRPFSGELLLKTQPERLNQQGNLVTTPAHIFAYVRNLHGKQLESFTLPNNENVGILSAVVSKAPVIALDEGFASLVLATTNLTGIDLMALTIKNESNIGAGGGPLTFFFADQPEKGSTTTPPTYTTKQVTVPMGQQTTIAYVAPDSTSQMTFYVQKGDDTCVGPTCSTYLTDWNSGSGDSKYFASNISPSLNSQMKSGQHWTMAIQNAGEGYYGYLDSPSGQNMPHPGGVPSGAQFKLMTQAEIATQPPWAVAAEKIVGEIVGVAILTVATGGIGDLVFAADVADVAIGTAGDATADAVAVADAGADVTGGLTETIAVDPFYFLIDGDGSFFSELGDMEDLGQGLVDGFSGDVGIIKTEGAVDADVWETIKY
jgi:hypothetical protein